MGPVGASGSPQRRGGPESWAGHPVSRLQPQVGVPVGAGGVRAARRGTVASRGMLLSGQVGATGPRHPGLLDGRGSRKSV